MWIMSLFSIWWNSVKLKWIVSSLTNSVEIISNDWTNGMEIETERQAFECEMIQVLDKYFIDDWRYLNVNKHNGWIEWHIISNGEFQLNSCFCVYIKFCRVLDLYMLQVLFWWLVTQFQKAKSSMCMITIRAR